MRLVRAAKTIIFVSFHRRRRGPKTIMRLVAFFSRTPLNAKRYFSPFSVSSRAAEPWNAVQTTRCSPARTHSNITRADDHKPCTGCPDGINPDNSTSVDRGTGEFHRTHDVPKTFISFHWFCKLERFINSNYFSFTFFVKFRKKPFYRTRLVKKIKNKY